MRAAHTEIAAKPTGSSWPTTSAFRSSAVAVSAMCGLVILGLFALSAEWLRESYVDAWLTAQRNSENLLHLAEQDVARNMELFDLSVQGVVENWDRPGLDKMAPDLQRAILFDRAATARYLDVMLVIDERGVLRIDSTDAGPQSIDYTTRDYFTHHRDTFDPGLYISKPYLASHSGEMSIGLSRRLSHPDGSFAGVVSGTMRLAYFRDLFNRINLGGEGSINLFRRDGTLLMRQPLTPGDVGRSIAGGATYREITAARHGNFVAPSSLDGVRRFYCFTAVGDLPLILDVAMAVDDIMAPWWRRATFIGLLDLGVGGVSALLTFGLLGELRRRNAAETRLRAANAELRSLAVTDGLTGLSNRRRFDELTGREWRRGSRTGLTFSLVTVDVDSFKAYNDLYGHSGGDAVLKEIAGQLGAAASRPGDAACRVGGEEFALILPDTDGAGAVIVAERVRASIAALALPHRGSAFGVVTVSIGVACSEAAVGLQALLDGADAALYRAKNGGRNQVCVWREDVPLATQTATAQPLVSAA